MIQKVDQAVVLAGGIGYRLRPLTDTIPKPMIAINGRPFLAYLIDILRENGIRNIVLLLGYLAEKVMDYFGTGSDFGVRIQYSVGGVSFETGARIRNADPLLSDHFLLLYCDNFWPLNIQEMLEFFNRDPCLASATVYENKDHITKNNVFVDEAGYILRYDRTRKDAGLNGVDIGFFLMDKKVFDFMPDSNFSFEEVVLPALVSRRQLRGFLTGHRYHSIGSLERLPVTEQFLRNRKAIVLDRDGVINRKPPRGEYVKKWEEFEFLPGAIEGIRLLNNKGFSVFIATNQAGIARGLMSESDLTAIHRNMIREVEKGGAAIEGIYYCPHGWDEGCECRKPKPGMFVQISRDHGIDLSKTFFVGDDERDFQAGEAAGCFTILLNKEKGLLDVARALD